MKSVLVCTPVHATLNTDTLRSLYEMQAPKGWRLDYFQPRYGYTTEDEQGRENLAEKQNTARKIAIDGHYDYILFIEEDMIVPPEALTRLLECKSDVAYGLYVFRRPPFLWSAFSVIDEDARVGYPLNVAHDRAIEQWGKVVDVDGIGFGCTLISRKVFEQIPFRIGWDEPHPGGEVSHSDFYFAVDCVRNGFTQRCNTRCICGHIISYPLPSILVPVLPGTGLEKTAYRFLPYGGYAWNDPLLMRFQEWTHTPNDMLDHLPFLRDIAHGTVVELGTRYGASTSAFLAGVWAKGDDGHVHSIDIEPRCASLFNHPQWTFHNHCSLSTVGVRPPVNVLFVDTEHTYEQVSMEIRVWEPTLAKGATVLFHDTEVEGVRHAVKEWASSHDYPVEWREASHGLAIVRT